MSKTIIRADIIAAIQSENGYSLRKFADTVETLIEIIKSTTKVVTFICSGRLMDLKRARYDQKKKRLPVSVYDTLPCRDGVEIFNGKCVQRF